MDGKRAGKLLTDNQAISDNVGPCQALFEHTQQALREERHFALVDGVALPTVGSLVISFEVRTQSDPSISSVTLSIMITTSDSSMKRSGIPNQLLGVRQHTIAISGLSLRTKLFQLLVVPSLSPHPVEAHHLALIPQDFSQPSADGKGACFYPGSVLQGPHSKTVRVKTEELW